MGVGYQMDYKVIIKGGREQFEEIPAVLQMVAVTVAEKSKAKKKSNAFFWGSNKFL